ncbi:hypothetical protein [Phenylobacterium deserti]|uniref:TonB-dependent receptor-like beta-barrel domain-containing protein n=1 Tax=Phenylobacterium deserti TaxID=1914756 RepID=A0A328ABI2_9CAUL|nr:hypothetical protein [Phenylobacterium deserti]RAK52082.1 hypothetical protein DJ018_13080 [Phenylobacterium deserti]
MHNELAQVAVDAYTAPATLGGRAQVGLKLGPVDASLKAAMERGGGGLVPAAEAWSAVNRPAEWTGDEVELGAVWAPRPDAKVTLDAGDRARQTLHYGSPLANGADDRMVTDQAQFVRLNAATKPAQNLEVRVGGEATKTLLESQSVDASDAPATALWTEVRRLFAGFTWKPAPKVTVEAGQSVQSLGVAWRGAGEAEAENAYVTPQVAVTITPWTNGKWRLAAEEAVSPLNPSQFASYAQLGGSAAGPTLEPDQGWRYAVRYEQKLPLGMSVAAGLLNWRLNSITELGPVGGGEAPVSAGEAEKRKLDINLSTPLEPMGLQGASLSGQFVWQWSEVADPFTGLQRSVSGESPYQAQLKLAGDVYGRDLSWRLTAQASGPQSIFQMAQVTTLSSTAGLGGALTYGAGPVRVSLELDNMLGGARTVTEVQFAGSRADGAPTGVNRRKDEARAVRIALKRRL